LTKYFAILNGLFCFLIKINKFFSCFIVKNAISREMQFTFISFLVIYIFSSTLSYANGEDSDPFSVPAEEESGTSVENSSLRPLSGKPIARSAPIVRLSPAVPFGAHHLPPLVLPAASNDLPIRQGASPIKGSMLHRSNESNH